MSSNARAPPVHVAFCVLARHPPVAPLGAIVLTSETTNGPQRKYARIRGAPGGAGLCPRMLVHLQCTSHSASSPGIHQWHLSVRPYSRRRPLVAPNASTPAFEVPLAAPGYVLECSCTSSARRILRPRPASTSGTSRCDRTHVGDH